MKSYIDRVVGNLETLIIQRGKGKDVVVISLTEYNRLINRQPKPVVTNDERKVWLGAQVDSFNRAFAEDEPEYPLSMVKEPNPDYEAG